MGRQDLIELRQGTAAVWEAANPLLALGEPGWVTDTGLLYVGDGVHDWAALEPVNGSSGQAGIYNLGTVGASTALPTLDYLIARCVLTAGQSTAFSLPPSATLPGASFIIAATNSASGSVVEPSFVPQGSDDVQVIGAITWDTVNSALNEVQCTNTGPGTWTVQAVTNGLAAYLQGTYTVASASGALTVPSPSVAGATMLAYNVTGALALTLSTYVQGETQAVEVTPNAHTYSLAQAAGQSLVAVCGSVATTGTDRHLLACTNTGTVTDAILGANLGSGGGGGGALSVTNLTTLSGTELANSITTGSVTPTAKSLLIVAMSAGGDGNTGTFALTDTFGDTGGGAWTSLGLATSGGYWWADVWYRQIGSGPGAGTITVAESGGYLFEPALNVDMVKDVHSAAPVAQTQSASANYETGATITLSSAPASTSAVYCAAACNGSAMTPTVTTANYVAGSTVSATNGTVASAWDVAGAPTAATAWEGLDGAQVNELYSLEIVVGP